MLQHILKKCTILTLFPTHRSNFFTKNYIFAVVNVKRVLQLQYQRMGLLCKFWHIGLTESLIQVDLHSNLEQGFLLQALDYFADTRFKSASFIIQYPQNWASLHQGNYSMKACIPHQAVILLELGPCLILLILITQNLTQFIFAK